MHTISYSLTHLRELGNTSSNKFLICIFFNSVRRNNQWKIELINKAIHFNKSGRGKAMKTWEVRVGEVEETLGGLLTVVCLSWTRGRGREECEGDPYLLEYNKASGHIACLDTALSDPSAPSDNMFPSLQRTLHCLSLNSCCLIPSITF